MKAEILQGDCRTTLAALPERWFHCCVTSPPYFGLRDYQVEGQIGLEPTPDEFVAALVEVFRGVWRVLRDDGVAWLNLGDSYTPVNRGQNARPRAETLTSIQVGNPHSDIRTRPEVIQGVAAMGLKQKDLMGIPWRVAFALQADGWYLRDAVIWHKPAPMPGSQQDRCTSSYEFIYQLTKQPRYFFDLNSLKGGGVRIESFGGRQNREARSNGKRLSGNERPDAPPVVMVGAAPRNVWRMASDGFNGSHFATFPVELPTRCIKASTSAKGCCPDCGAPWERITERTKLRRERPNELTKRTGANGTGNHCANTVAGVEARTLGWQPTCKCGNESVVPCRVLDCFNGAGTTAVAARRLGLDYTGCELNPDYIEMTHKRLRAEANRGADLKTVESAPGQATLF